MHLTEAPELERGIEHPTRSLSHTTVRLRLSAELGISSAPPIVGGCSCNGPSTERRTDRPTTFTRTDGRERSCRISIKRKPLDRRLLVAAVAVLRMGRRVSAGTPDRTLVCDDERSGLGCSATIQLPRYAKSLTLGALLAIGAVQLPRYAKSLTLGALLAIGAVQPLEAPHPRLPGVSVPRRGYHVSRESWRPPYRPSSGHVRCPGRFEAGRHAYSPGPR